MPTTHNIGFADIIILAEDLAEIIVKENIELTLEKVHHIHQTLRDNLAAQFSLLVNKINNYSYDFEGMQEIGTINELKSIAIICYSDKTEKNSEYLISLVRKRPLNAKIFNCRNKALDWLSQ